MTRTLNCSPGTTGNRSISQGIQCQFRSRRNLNDPAIAEFRKFSKTVEEATKLKADWDSDLEQRRVHVESIKEGLKAATSSYNFVGLVNGFRHLAATKNHRAQGRISGSLIALALVMVAPPSAQIAYVLSHIPLSLRRDYCCTRCQRFWQLKSSSFTSFAWFLLSSDLSRHRFCNSIFESPCASVLCRATLNTPLMSRKMIQT